MDLGEIEIRIGIRFLLLVLVADGDDAEDAIVLRDAKLLPESLFDFWPSAITTMARGAVPRGVVPCFL